MNTTGLLRLLGFILLPWLLSTSAFAAGWTPQARDAVVRFLKVHPSLEGRDYSVQWTEPRNTLPTCDKLPRVNLQNRDRAWGKVFLTLNCEEGRPWVRPVSVYVMVKGRYLVANQALRKGQALNMADLQWAEGDLTKMGDTLLEDPEQIKNMELARPIQAGTPLRLNDLKPIAVIKSGDQVRVTLLGKGFAIDTSGQAMSEAALGSSVKVRISDGKIVQGTAVSQGAVDVLID
jgi:flagella basal body P-ring formation protein FlgA